MPRMSFSAIGTKWSIAVVSNEELTEWSRLESDIQKIIDDFDKSFSRFRKDSWVTNLYEHPGTYALPPHAYELLCFYEKLYRVTGGLVTPLIGQLMEDAGYDAEYSLKDSELRAPGVWDDELVFTKEQLTTTRPVLLDFGAAGKGYLVDLLGDLFARNGLRNYVINAGGDILHYDKDGPSVLVGLENPFNTTEIIGEIAIKNQSICASAGSRRKWGKYHHIINPKTLESPTKTAATWVIAADTMTADGIATALFFTPAKKLRDHFEFEYGVLASDGELAYSAGFQVKLNEAENV